MKNFIVILAFLLSNEDAVSQSVDSLQYHLQHPIEKVLVSGALGLKIKTSESYLILTLDNAVKKLSIISTDSIIASSEDRLFNEFCKSIYLKSIKVEKIIILLKILSYVDDYSIQYHQGDGGTIDEQRLFIKDGEKVLVRTVYINVKKPVR